MSARAMSLLVQMSMYGSAAIIVVALLRPILRRMIGAQLAYWLWALVPACAAAAALPPPLRMSTAHIESFARPLITMVSDTELRLLTNARPDYADIGLSVWMFVGVTVFLFMAHRQQKFVRSLGPLAPAPDGTYRSATACGPLLLGILQPRVVLPENFETFYRPEERALVLAHERAHWRRGDTIVNAAANLCLCIFWFNPLMYWAIGRLRFDQELACDARVLAGSDRRWREYASALLKAQLAADAVSYPIFGCHWQSGHPLKERIVMIKAPPLSLARRLSGAIAVVTLVTGCSYTTWASQATGPEGKAQPSQSKISIIMKEFAGQTPAATDGGMSGRDKAAVNSAPKAANRWKARGSIRANTITNLEDGTIEALGSVRIAFEDTVIESDRAILHGNGVIEDEGSMVEALGSVRIPLQGSILEAERATVLGNGRILLEQVNISSRQRTKTK